MTSYVEQDRQPRRIQWRLALGAIAGILALGIVWLPAQEGTILLVLKIGCTLALWAFFMAELAITGQKVRQAQTAERRAEHTRQVLTEAFDMLPHAVAIYDPADQPILVNQRFSELQGPDLPTSGASTGDIERSLPDGRWVRIDGHRTRNGYRVTVSSDITELKRQKAELARRSRLLDMTLNAADRGICIWGPDGRLSLWNGQVAGLLDLPIELLATGRPFTEFEAFLAGRGEAALAGIAGTATEPGRMPPTRVRYEHVRPDGHVLDVICTNLPDGGRMVSYGDITAFRRVERDPEPSALVEQASSLTGIALPDDARIGARRLLLVEDSVTNQLVASTMLKIAGYQVDVAANGLEAIEAVNATAFDLVLMDIAMPEMDGIAATRAIRALPAPAGRIPIIAMTANAMLGDRERFLDAGMNDYVPKPIERPYLLASIARWLPAAPASREDDISDVAAALAAPVNPPQDDALDLAVLEQLKHDLDEIVVPDLIDAFLDEARERSRRIVEAIAVGNFTIIEREAHTLKSSAGTFGAARLARAVLAIEQTCREADMEATGRLSDMILALVEEASDAYRALGLVSSPVAETPVLT
jgi:CheY-like chemotaxis protein/PAS domain-containing protein/HPt (histidine-containing phosphotransfer) domain-containing protein